VRVVVIEDDGVSAFKVSIFDRPGSRRLYEMVEADQVDAVHTDSVDRLTRGDDGGVGVVPSPLRGA
jgi:hypothetical protein